MAASSFEDLNKTVTDMRNDLICEICETTPRPGKTQWFRCLKLHQICQDCKSKSKKCSCGEPISKEHCKMTEKLLNTKRMKLNCKNTKNGCREVLADSALDDHESECIFRYVDFIRPSDPYKIIKMTFKDLVEEVQKYPLIQKGRNQESIERDTAITFRRFQFAMKTFLFVEGIPKDGIPKSDTKAANAMIATVVLIGTIKEAKNFSYTLKYFGPKCTNTFEGQVESVDEPPESHDNHRGGKSFGSFVTHANFFKRTFVKEDGTYEYSLEVKNLKEEAKDENYESGISDEDQETKK